MIMGQCSIGLYRKRNDKARRENDVSFEITGAFKRLYLGRT